MKHLLSLLAIAGIVSTVSYAAPIVEDTWDTGNPNSWTTVDGIFGSPSSAWADSTSVGGQVGFVSTTGDGGTGADEFVYTQDPDYTGNYITGGYDSGAALPVQNVFLDFYSNPGGGFTDPAALRMFFVSDLGGASEHTWFYDLNVGSTGWNSFSVSLNNGYWYSMDGGVSLYDDLQNVDRLGVYINYQPGVSDQVYGLDNFSLDDSVLIPEPGTFMFLGFAFVSLGVTFRRRLSELVAKVRS